MRCKFKHNDKVKIIGTDCYGELTWVHPQQHPLTGQIAIVYELYSLTDGVKYVQERHLEKVDKLPWETKNNEQQ